MIKCFIDNVEYKVIAEPQAYLNRFEEDDASTIRITTDRTVNFDIYSKVKLVLSNEEELQFVIQGVRPQKLAPNYFEHTIELVENKAYFKTVYPSDRNFTRLIETETPNVFRQQNIRDILDVYKTHLEAYHSIFIDFDTTDTLYDIQVPQKEYIARNFLEILTDLFRRIEAIPRIFWNDEDEEWFIDYELYAERKDELDLSSFQNLTKELTNVDFGQSMLAQAKNAVYEDQPVVFPSKTGYVKPRSTTKVFQDSTAEVVLDSNIFRLDRVILKDVAIHLVNPDSQSALPFKILDIDITDYVVLKEEQDSFDEVGRTESVAEELSFRNTILYELGNNKLFGLFTPNFETFFGFNANVDHLRNLVNSYLKFKLPELEPINLPEGTFYQLSPPGFHDYGDGVIDNTNLINNNVTTVVKNSKWTITYVPQRDIDFEIDRQDISRTTDSQVLNSQADSVIELGRYKQSVGGLINRLGNEQLQYHKLYKYDQPLPKLGDYLDEYIVTEVNYTFFRKHIDVLLKLSKNFNNVKAEYAVSREPSPFSITGKTVNTNLITRTFVELSKTKKANLDQFATQFGRDAILNVFDYDSQFDSEIQEAAFTPKGIAWEVEYGQDAAIHMPVMKSGNGGAMTFHFQFRSPNLAGFAQATTNEDGFWPLTALVKSGVFYTDRNGYLPEYTLKIGEGIDVNDDFGYPLVDLQLSNQFKNSFNILNFPIDLDSNAKYAHTHHVQPVTDNADKIIINENLTRLHPLVTGQAIETLKFYKSNKPFSIFDHIVRDGDTEFFNSLTLDREERSIVLDMQPPQTNYWCITDNDDNILVAFNYSPENFKLYFNFVNFREKLVDGEVVFETLGGVPVPDSIIAPVGTVIDEPIETPVKAGFIFLGWDTEFPFEIEELFKTVTAEYVEIVFLVNPNLQESAPYYESSSAVVTFNTLNGQPVPAPFVGNINDVVARPQVDPFKAGFIFLDWDTVFPLTIVQQFTTVAAIYVEINEIVKPGLQETAPYYVEQQPKPIPPRPILQPSIMQAVSPYYVVANVPTPPEPEIVTATFDIAGGQGQPAGQSGPIPFAVQQPTQPIRNGYNFLGWVDLNQPLPRPPVTFPYTIFEDTVLQAQWQVINYNITYILNGGTNNPGNPATYNAEQLPITLLNPTRFAFDFTGWTPINVIDVGEIGNKTFTANWTQAKLATPTAEFVSSTQTSITFRVRNNDSRPILGTALRWEIRDDTPSRTLRASGQIDPANAGQFYNVSFNSATANTSYVLTGVQALDIAAGDFLESNFAADVFGSTQQLQTAQPTFESTSSTSDSISFRIRNQEQAEVLVRRELGAAPDAQSPTLTIGSGGLSDVITITGLQPNTPYTIGADAIRTDATKTRSEVGTVTITTAPPPQTAIPSTFSVDVTADSVTFELRNNDNTAGVARWEIQRQSDSAVMAFANNITIDALNAANDTITATATGLAPGVYRFINTFVTATGKTESPMGIIRSQTVPEPPPLRTVKARVLADDPVSTTATWSLTSTGYNESGQTAITRFTYANLRTDVPNGATGSVTAPSSVIANDQTFTLTRWIVNGINQPSGEQTVNFSVNEDIDLEVLYGAIVEP